jgi:hypothetical protein
MIGKEKAINTDGLSTLAPLIKERCSFFNSGKSQE